MNRYEQHREDARPFLFDACQVQLILEARLPRGGWPSECTAASIGLAIARHVHRRTFVRYSAHFMKSQSWHALNPTLHERLRAKAAQSNQDYATHRNPHPPASPTR